MNDDVESLRRLHYNATVVHVRRVHDELMVLRVRPDAGPVQFVPGQYTTLGLGTWERGVNDDPPVRDLAHAESGLIRRAYSFSAAMADANGAVLPPEKDTANEFYIALVHAANAGRAMLTPKLFALGEGVRLYVGPKAKGRYTTEDVSPDDTAIFVATGTGEAPHNAMVAHLLANGHRGRIVAVTCVRRRRDLAYMAAHEALAAAHANYQYVWLTTREPQNKDPSAAGYVGKRYVQDFFSDGSFERRTGIALRPDGMHVFLCGNPRMIGDTPREAASAEPAVGQSPGMIQVLENMGFALDRPEARGTIHVEKYW
jgi:ferredoxin--NADP+ reductase